MQYVEFGFRTGLKQCLDFLMPYQISRLMMNWTDTSTDRNGLPRVGYSLHSAASLHKG